MASLTDLRPGFRALDAGYGESERRGGNHPVINSILWPFADVSADRARGGAGVADRSLDHSPGRDDRRRHLGRGEDLSRRRADVRQTAHSAGTGQVVEVQLKKGSGGWDCGLRIADCGLRIADCGMIKLSISISSPRANILVNPQSAIPSPILPNKCWELVS